MRTRPSVIAASCVTLMVVSVHAADPPITASQTGDHIGKRATVCGGRGCGRQGASGARWR